VIHYGSTIYDPERFKPIWNCRKVSKPIGGLWTSPIGSSVSWLDWCREQSFRDYPDYLNFKLKFKKDTKILLIDKKCKLNELPLVRGLEHIGAIDFESISKIYDALWFTTKGLKETEDAWPVSLMCWDVESVLIFNTHCIYQVN
jgi:pullulanase/glycogen debranching enzyme